MNNAKDYEIHFLTTTINDPIPSGIIKVKNRISDFIALGGKLILSDPTVATGELLKEITKEIVREDVSRMKAAEELMMVKRVEEVWWSHSLSNSKLWAWCRLHRAHSCKKYKTYIDHFYIKWYNIIYQIKGKLREIIKNKGEYL